MAKNLCGIFRNLKILKIGLSNRGIMTTTANAKKFLEALKDNPYFDKYSAAIAKLQKTDPEEFLSRIENKAEKNKNTRKSVYKILWNGWRIFHGANGTKWNVNRVFMRNYSDFRMQSVYITTPIFYVNAGPHIGHLYTAALADTYARYNLMLGHETFVVAGTDEHGNKVQNAAIHNKLLTQNYCDKISESFKNMCDTFDVNYNKFIRTTNFYHKETVHQFWNTLVNGDHIYLGTYSGWYCTSDEAFVSESELEEKKVANGESIKISRTSGHPVEWMEEENYKFRLSAFQDDLRYWLKDEKSVRPSKYHKILSSWVEDGSCLEDLSISRPISRVPWGIKVPQDDNHTIYVWLDALVNYLTAVNYSPTAKISKFWPPSLQVIGKDILKFHGIYWPAFLIAAKLEPPRTLLCHSHWTVNDEKMSKSKGNVVCPFDTAQAFTPDGLRYFLLREAVPHNDANYNDRKVQSIINTELADTLGNLVSRCMGKSINPQKIIPEPNNNHVTLLNTTEALNLAESLQQLSSIAKNNYDDFNLHHVVDTVMQALFLANRMVEHHKPWILAKEKLSGNKDSDEKLNAVLALACESARIGALVLLPIIPRLSSELLSFLNVPKTARTWTNCEFLNTGRKSADDDEADEISYKSMKKENYSFFKKINCITSCKKNYNND